MAKVYSSSRAASSTVWEVLDTTLSELGIRGKKVLLKPNMVDPDHPDACSWANNLHVATQYLTSRGVDKVLIGDEPATYIYRRAQEAGEQVDIMSSYSKLSWNHIPYAELVDTSQMPTTNYTIQRVSPLTGENESIDVPVRDTSGLIVISFTQPKQHGQFTFSGTSKNLMGLVPNEARPALFHDSFYRAAREAFDMEGIDDYTREEIGHRVLNLAVDYAEKYSRSKGQDILDPTSGIVPLALSMLEQGRLDYLSFEVLLEHALNSSALEGLIKHFNNRELPTIGFLDGTHFLTKQEHEGDLVPTNFMMASDDVRALDIAALNRLGIDPEEVPYLTYDALEEPVKVYGPTGTSLPRASLLEKEIKGGFVWNR